MSPNPTGHTLVSGVATGTLLYATVPLSFWGGIDTKTGTIIDKHHPLCDNNMRGKILAIPSARGSCSGSGAMLELLLNKCAPAAIVFASPESIITLGVWIARAMFDMEIPVVVLGEEGFRMLGTGNGQTVRITEDSMIIESDEKEEILFGLSTWPSLSAHNLNLSVKDQAMLDGKQGEASKLAMEVLVLFAKMQGADTLIDVSQAHIDACVYIGPSTLIIPETLLRMGAKCAVPTTLNALSVDKRRWRELGTNPDISTAASKVGDTYLKMGAKVSFTCAPYLLESAPKTGEQVGWAESNAVVYANSVLGARTQKYPDYIDVFIAITGRAPNAGCHTEAGRQPTVYIDVPKLDDHDDSFYPLLGYCIGALVGSSVPMITGLESHNPTAADLKAFGAAFATTSAAPMFHIRGITPEASKYDTLANGYKHFSITLADIRMVWSKLNTAITASVDAVTLGNPHFALEEFAASAQLTLNQIKHPNTNLIITASREVHDKAVENGYVAELERFGAIFITDTCWCMLEEPVVPVHARNLMTNSAKYAHYGPGLTRRGFHFGSLSECVQAAVKGEWEGKAPGWLSGEENNAYVS